MKLPDARDNLRGKGKEECKVKNEKYDCDREEQEIDGIVYSVYVYQNKENADSAEKIIEKMMFRDLFLKIQSKPLKTHYNKGSLNWFDSAKGGT